MHALVGAIIVLVVVAVVLFIGNVFLGDKMDPRFKSAIVALVCLVAFLYVISLFGFFPVGH